MPKQGPPPLPEVSEMAVYKHFCMYCDKLVPGDANVCPFCGAEDPFTQRCPKCRGPLEKGYLKCPSCGLDLKAICPACSKPVAAYLRQCPECGASMLGTCTNKKCGNTQLYSLTTCIKCKSKVVR